jgi:hypothetical protein
MVSLVCLNCLWLVLALKVLQLCTNHFVLVLCKSVWVIEACHFFLVPSWNSNMPLYPSIVLRTREHASTLCSFVVFSLGFRFESLKELGVRQIWFHTFDLGAKTWPWIKIQWMSNIPALVWRGRLHVAFHEQF